MSESFGASILLIDDTLAHLNELEQALIPLLKEHKIEVRPWRPSEADVDPLKKFESLVDTGTLLVATDYDLTSGVRGLFGLTIVAWCQQRAIPVGDFSRGNVSNLPQEPNLFEFRIPTAIDEAAAFIATAALGFNALREALGADTSLLEKRSLASVLAAILKRPEMESQFALYMSRLGAANSSLIQKLREEYEDDTEPTSDEKKALLTYVLGHVLFNSILKYPGPILFEQALCAYLATDTQEADALATMFANAAYKGPFAQAKRYLWRDEIESILDALAANLDDEKFETSAELYRKAVEEKLGRSLATHQCERCGGVLGGFFCPFTRRAVCIRSDCSVAASSWIPQGAQLCRVEKVFYDEWAPLLGL